VVVLFGDEQARLLEGVDEGRVQPAAVSRLIAPDILVEIEADAVVSS
jgi:hypothetical protein